MMTSIAAPGSYEAPLAARPEGTGDDEPPRGNGFTRGFSISVLSGIATSLLTGS
jgi:hypothetical protein